MAVIERTGHLFNPEIGALTGRPSDELIKRAERLQASQARVEYGVITRWVLRKVKLRHPRVLLPLAVVEIIPELLTTGLYGSIQRARRGSMFSNQLIREFPHVVEGYDPSKEKPPVGCYTKGSVTAYRDAVLRYAVGSYTVGKVGTRPPSPEIPARVAARAAHAAPSQTSKLDIVGVTR
jgi:hypothetical protein